MNKGISKTGKLADTFNGNSFTVSDFGGVIDNTSFFCG